MWAALAYNEFWGFMGGYFSIVEGVINLAVFPTVTLDYVMVLPVARTRAFWCQDMVANNPLANLAVSPTVTLDYGMVLPVARTRAFWSQDMVANNLLANLAVFPRFVRK